MATMFTTTFGKQLSGNVWEVHVAVGKELQPVPCEQESRNRSILVETLMALADNIT